MSAAVGSSSTGGLFTMSANVWVAGTVSVGTSAEAVPLSEVTTPHWCYLKNLDATNYVKVRNGSAGADLIRLVAGAFAVFPMETTATPYWIANSAACLVHYLILGA